MIRAAILLAILPVTASATLDSTTSGPRYLTEGVQAFHLEWADGTRCVILASEKGKLLDWECEFPPARVPVPPVKEGA